MPHLAKRSRGQLPRLAETWLIAVARLRTWMAAPDGKTFRPYGILVFSAAEGTVRASQITPASPAPGVVWETLSHATRHPDRGTCPLAIL